MYYFLITLVIGFFVAMVFLNVYFRVRVLKAYKALVQARVNFDPKHVFNDKKLEEEVLPKYPEQAEHIRNFVRHLRYSIKMLTVLMVLITLLGAILMQYGRK